MGRRGDGGGSPEGLTKATTTPCAACKLLRRKCAQECPFSPYFSSSEPQKFACVHKIFGASNVSKMLMEVPENQRADVANSLVYEANARIRDPVYGCLGVISALQQQAQSLQAELHAVRTQIMRFRFQESAMAAAASAHNHHSSNNYNLNSTNNNIGTPIISAPLAFKVPASTRTHSPTSCQTTVNSNDCYTTIATSHHESPMASVDLKEHYWSQLHQSS